MIRSIGARTVCLLAVLVIARGARAAATLYAVTGDGATAPETLYTLNQTDGSKTLVTALGNGTEGEAIGFNPANGLLYHFSGIASIGVVPPELNNPATGSIMETINPATLAINPISIQGNGFDENSPFRSDEVRSVVYNPAGGNLLVAARDDFYSVSLTGVCTFLGPLYDQGNGLAFVGSDLYMLDYDNSPHTRSHLRKINPADGSSISAVEITLAGVVLDKGLSLATHPDTGQLWAILLDAALNRRLVTVDPVTGVATQVGILNDRFASIAFVPEPAGTVALGGSLFIACLARRPVQRGNAICRRCRRRRRRSNWC